VRRKRILALWWLLSLLLIVVVGGLFMLVASFWWEMHVQSTLGPEIEERYGFEIGTPYVQAGERSVEVIAIESIDAHKAFNLAGFAQWDIIVSHPSIAAIYRGLDVAPGEQVTLGVVRGWEGPPIEERPVRSLVVTAP
jgi:hypothetical protein